MTFAALSCNADPVACIDFLVLWTQEFLKDWTTLAMLATLLFLLLKLRAQQAQKREATYAARMLVYDDKRTQENVPRTWVVEDGQATETPDRD
jgi:hypothetical protein